MPDVLAPTAAIAAPAWRGRELSLAAPPGEVIVHLEGLHRTPPADGMPAPRRCAQVGGGTVLSIGPDTCLWLGREQPSYALRQRFKAAVDVSGAWTPITLTGVNALPLLRKGCAVDLHPRHFPEWSCAVTSMAAMRVVLWKPDPSASYGLLVSRSYAVSFWDWLVEAAAEFQHDATTEQK
jgi:heterotetrameric sarcosine oxidase gamma subunit